MKFDISIVIPCRPHDPMIYNVLKSLETQKQCNFEVLLIVNPPTSTKMKFDFSYKLSPLESSQGANFARNTGLRHTSSDLVMFLDSDCIVEDPYLLEKYIQHMNNHPELTGCGGPYQIPENSTNVSQVYQSLQMDWLYSGIIDHSLKTQYLLGGNLVLRKSKMNGSEFDEKIIFGGTELELILRLVKDQHSFQLLEQQKVIHVTKLSLFDMCKKAYQQGQGQLYTKKKLNLLPQKPQKIFIQQIQNPFLESITFKSYSLFFELGTRTWFKKVLSHAVKTPISLYHRIYFYLNLVKRLK